MQNTVAAFPDRPGSGGVGLEVALAAGNDGAYLVQPLSSPVDEVHVRVMAEVNSLANGAVSFLRLVNDADFSAVDVRFDATTSQLQVVADDQMLTSDVSTELSWHCFEIRADRSALQIDLWIDGKFCGSLSASSLDSIAAVWLGGIIKDTAASGAVLLDEWVIADAYIGPVVIEPVSAHADDPARWLVVYNRAASDSISWAQAYRDARQVPYANLLALDLPTTEQITSSQFASLRNDVSTYLSLNGLDTQVVGILCGHGVPGTYTRSGGDQAMIAAQLQFIDGTDNAIANPHAALTLPDRMPAADLGGYRMTARIDGPTLADSLALHTSAIDLQTNGLGVGDDATIWLDPVADGVAYEVRQDQMLDWAAGLARQQLRLPIQTTQPMDPASDVQFTQIDRDGFFLGWRQASVPSGFFGTPAGKRIFSMQMTDLVATAPTLRDAASNSWAIGSLQAGYAAAAGSSDTSFVGAEPSVEPFFDALRLGWTLAEAWFVSIAVLRSPTALIGDPLLTAAFPKNGWDVFGPFADQASVRFDSPLAHLRESELELPLVDGELPGDGEDVLLAVRHVDQQGRSDGQATMWALRKIAGAWHKLPAGPAWPSQPNWKPRVEAGAAVVDLVWPMPIRSAGIASVQLYAQPDSQSWILVDQIEPDGIQRCVQLSCSLTETPTALRVDLIDVDGNVFELTESAQVSRPAITPATLVSL